METKEQASQEVNKHEREPRLDVFKNGKGLTFFQKLPLLPIRLFGGAYPGPYLVMNYRSYLLGKAFSKNLRESMRNSAHWHKQDLELFASFTAAQLQCDY